MGSLMLIFQVSRLMIREIMEFVQTSTARKGRTRTLVCLTESEVFLPHHPAAQVRVLHSWVFRVFISLPFFPMVTLKCLKALLLKVRSLDQQHWNLLWAHQNCRICFLEWPNENPNFYKIPWWFLCPLNFKKYWSRRKICKYFRQWFSNFVAG